MGDRLAERPLAEPHQRRLPPSTPRRAEIVAAHAQALEAGDDVYVDPVSGLSVFTSGYLAASAQCCDSGCRHCPYLE